MQLTRTLVRRDFSQNYCLLAVSCRPSVVVVYLFFEPLQPAWQDLERVYVTSRILIWIGASLSCFLGNEMPTAADSEDVIMHEPCGCCGPLL